MNFFLFQIQKFMFYEKAHGSFPQRAEYDHKHGRESQISFLQTSLWKLPCCSFTFCKVLLLNQCNCTNIVAERFPENQIHLIRDGYTRKVIDY